jgi:arylsulfatase A-like enzyme
VAHNPDQSRLTTWYTERAVRFIEQNRERPFFLYVPHNMPHVPLFVSDKQRGKSERGLFGDVIQEIDWSVGEIVAALDKHSLAANTLVVFISDNGPWLSYGDHAGTAGPLREGKGTTFEGGVRVPFVARWPGRIPAAAVCREPAMTVDLLPTLTRLAGGGPPEGHIIDGLDIWPLLSGQAGATSPHAALYFYWGQELQAIRSGPWKLHFAHTYRSLGDKPGSDGKPGPYVQRQIEQSLFHLGRDIGESTDLAAQHPDVVERLQQLADKARDDLGDSATKRQGKNVRAPGRVAG